MACKRAKALDDKQFEKLVDHAAKTSLMPARDLLILALSFKAGLRIGEIQKIDLSAMLDSSGDIADSITIFSNVGKKQSERSIPMHSLVRQRLIEFMKTYPSATFVAISAQPWRWMIEQKKKIPTNARHKRMSATSLTNYFNNKLVKGAGLKDASSHSGRRTFITRMAQQANLHHCSLRDVQLLAGHANIKTTETYIEVSKEARSLVNAI